MKLFYQSWNSNTSTTNQIMEAVKGIRPFSLIFDDMAQKTDLVLPKSSQPTYDVWPVAQENAVDISKERLVIVTTEKIYESTSLNPMEQFLAQLGFLHLYGITFRDQGVSFSRPIRHDRIDSRDMDVTYGVELVAHEVGGGLIWNNYENCGDERCFVYGKPKKAVNGDLIPPYGRDHFCKQHTDQILTNAGLFSKGKKPRRM